MPNISGTAGFTGMVLALQGYHTLRKFGSEGLLGPAVALSLIRELGPVLTALMVTGRAGSALTAELGIMRIGDQIDSLETMGIDPIRYLVSPRLVGVKLLGVNAGDYFGHMKDSVELGDVVNGLWKSLVFALLNTWVCSFKGFFTERDDQATRRFSVRSNSRFSAA